jgi:circadian clock protein KaiB
MPAAASREAKRRPLVAKPRSPSTKETLESSSKAIGDTRYVLRLYVAGLTPQSRVAIRNVTAICEEHLAGRYDLQVIDIYQQPVLAKGEQIIAAPTLIKKLPLPLRKLIGSMADKEKVLVGLDLRAKRT